MRKAKNLYPLIATTENLYDAFRKAARGKRLRPDVVTFSADFDANIRSLQSQLRNMSFSFFNYRFFTITDPKIRLICAAPFPERVLQHAIMNVCGEAFETYLIFDSYACRKNKGNTKALSRAQDFCRKNQWYLKLDIRKYFDSIDHKIAMRLLERRFADNDLLHLFREIICSYNQESGRGIPVGNLFSQYLANYYLGNFDHWIKEDRKVRHYLRYMDDFILFSTDKDVLKNELRHVTEFLRSRLVLELKHNIQLNKTERGVPFLGHRLFPTHTRLLSEGIKRFSSRHRECEKKYRDGSWPVQKMVQHLDALYAHAGSNDFLAMRRNFFEKIRVPSREALTE